MAITLDVMREIADEARRLCCEADRIEAGSDTARTLGNCDRFVRLMAGEIEELRRQLAAATARAEKAEAQTKVATDARDALVQRVIDLEHAAASRPDPPGRGEAAVGRDDLKTLVELRACARAWDPEACLLGNNRAGDIAKALDAVLDAVVAASRPTAAADVEGVARRIVSTIEAIAGIERDDTDDARSLNARWHELVEWPAYQSTIDKAKTQARVEFVARVLSELTERRPAAIAVCDNRDVHAFEANGVIGVTEPFQVFIVRDWYFHPAGRPDAAGESIQSL